jgi:hypothetical protein
MISIDPVSNEVTKARNGLSTTCFVCFPKSVPITISRAALYRVLDVERIWIEITRWHCPHKAYGLMNFSEAIQNMDHRIIALIFP